MVEMIAAMECKTEEAWVGSGRVNAYLYPTRPMASLTLKQAMLSLDRLSIKASFFSFFSEGTVTNPAV